jgi:hypothetical protein
MARWLIVVAASLAATPTLAQNVDRPEGHLEATGGEGAHGTDRKLPPAELRGSGPARFSARVVRRRHLRPCRRTHREQIRMRPRRRYRIPSETRCGPLYLRKAGADARAVPLSRIGSHQRRVAL